MKRARYTFFDMLMRFLADIVLPEGNILPSPLYMVERVMQAASLTAALTMPVCTIILCGPIYHAQTGQPTEMTSAPHAQAASLRLADLWSRQQRAPPASSLQRY